MLSTLLATYSNERMKEIKLKVHEEQDIKDISREEIERLIRWNGLSSIANGLKDNIKKGAYTSAGDQLTEYHSKSNSKLALHVTMMITSNAEYCRCM